MTSLANCPVHGLWKKTASILLVGPGKYGRPCVLTVKRSSKATFMPNHIVFPGGLCEQPDFSPGWLKQVPVYEKFSVSEEAVFPDIFNNDSNGAAIKEISPHLGFRLTALRELVEEAGLVVDQKSENICVVGDETRKQIHSDPETFCESMKQLDIIPDIWRLHDWSTWLTPIGLKDSSRRYDTQFYIVILDNIDDIKASSDNNEVSTVEFWDVADILMAAHSGKVVVAPPQMYELGRLLNFSNMEELKEYVRMRHTLGTERLFPVHIKCSDGALRVLPGDSLYPEVPDVEGSYPPMKLNMTISECRERYPQLHRISLVKGKAMKLEINIKLGLNQVPPAYAVDNKFAASML